MIKNDAKTLKKSALTIFISLLTILHIRDQSKIGLHDLASHHFQAQKLTIQH